MNINTGYIAIKEVSYDSLKKTFSFPKKFNGESRFAEVLGVTTKSLFAKGDIVIHEKAAPYFPALDLGEGCFYVPENEVNSKLVNGNIVSIFELVYVDVDKEKKYTIDVNGHNFKLDADFRRFKDDIVTQHGVVVSVPLRATNSYVDEDLKIELEVGDIVYAHHFLTHDDNETVFDGKRVFSIRYEDCYCRVRNGEYKMLNEWNFLIPILEDKSNSHIGNFKIKNELENDTMRATVKYASDKLVSVGANNGDTVFFKKDCDYRIDVNGEILYRVNSRDIVAKLK